MFVVYVIVVVFFFNDTATTEIYTLSLHDALPICCDPIRQLDLRPHPVSPARTSADTRSEEHTSELQSHSDLVCRLLLETKKERRGRRLASLRRDVYIAPRLIRGLENLFFFNDTATTEIYTLSLHDALPI